MFDPCYIRTAFYFKTLEGFVEAGPQLALQLSLLFRGNWTDSSMRAIEPYVGEGVLGVAAVPYRSLEVFGRHYQEGERGYS